MFSGGLITDNGANKLHGSGTLLLFCTIYIHQMCVNLPVNCDTDTEVIFYFWHRVFERYLWWDRYGCASRRHAETLQTQADGRSIGRLVGWLGWFTQLHMHILV